MDVTGLDRLMGNDFLLALGNQKFGLLLLLDLRSAWAINHLKGGGHGTYFAKLVFFPKHSDEGDFFLFANL